MSGVEACGKTYHEGCLKCSGCERVIADQFSVVAGRPVCTRGGGGGATAAAAAAAAMRVCSKCGKPALDESVAALGSAPDVSASSPTNSPCSPGALSAPDQFSVLTGRPVCTSRSSRS
ncbi:hypothetical protein T484DRAFT_1854525 [Baffinella frigidus]|nr:hypothetical protein T484DRAFT_1854525 [Cryptophyta sp. CCMP2293]